MDYKKEFERIMETEKTIALATSTNNEPNVRIVNFYYDKKGILYFSTFGRSEKVEEVMKNNQVSFTIIPTIGTEHIRVKNGRVKKSNLTIFDLKEQFISKIPDYKKTIEVAGENLLLFEIHFKKAKVILDFDKIETINI